MHHYLFSTISVILFYIQALHAKIHTIEILASAYLDFIFTSDGRWDSFSRSYMFYPRPSLTRLERKSNSKRSANEAENDHN